MKKLLAIRLTMKKMYHSSMYINLLQKYYDKQCELFINGYIDLCTFTLLEKEYFKQVELFTYCLN